MFISYLNNLSQLWKDIFVTTVYDVDIVSQLCYVRLAKLLATSSLKHAYVEGSAILLLKRKKDFARDSAITIFFLVILQINCVCKVNNRNIFISQGYLYIKFKLNRKYLCVYFIANLFLKISYD